MDHALAGLIASATAFVGTHFALSHPLRAPLVRSLGQGGFMGLYSVVALATFGWMALAFRAVPPAAPLWDGFAPAPWSGATLLMLIAAVLLVGSLQGNPALPAPNAAEAAARGPRGVFLVTRHPIMWSFALWSISHVIVSPTPRVLVLNLAMAFLALVGSHLQDRKKAMQMGKAWQGWQTQTSYWPRLGSLSSAGIVPWLGGTALWLIASWAHSWLIAMPAGVWRCI